METPDNLTISICGKDGKLVGDEPIVYLDDAKTICVSFKRIDHFNNHEVKLYDKVKPYTYWVRIIDGLNDMAFWIRYAQSLAIDLGIYTKTGGRGAYQRRRLNSVDK